MALAVDDRQERHIPAWAPRQGLSKAPSRHVLALDPVVSSLVVAFAAWAALALRARQEALNIWRNADAGLKSNLRSLLVVQGDEYWLSRILGGPARWFFDTLKNMLTVGLLLAIADKTGSMPLKVLGQVAVGMLVLTAMGPTRGWYLDPLHQ